MSNQDSIFTFLTLVLPLLMVSSMEVLPQPEDFICGANTKYYYPCKPCPIFCDDRKVDCNEGCRAGCACKPGYVLESSDPANCVLKEQCMTCGPLEVFVTSTAHCQDTCENFLDKMRQCTPKGAGGCRCKNGFVRYNGKCILPSECP